MLAGALVSLLIAVGLLLLGGVGSDVLSMAVINPFFSIFILLFGNFLAGYATRNTWP